MENTKTADEFKQWLTSTVNSGYATMRIALGSQLGIFQKMSEFKEYKTSQDIANSLGFKERYVREWLNGMVNDRVVAYNKTESTYFLPEQYRASLCSMTALCSISVPLVGQVFLELVDAFKKDGPPGVPYSLYRGINEWRSLRVNSEFNDRYIADHFSKAPDILEKLEKGMTVVDLGCGVGGRILSLASKFPNSTFYGYDLDEEAIENAQKQLDSTEFKNVTFGTVNICEMPTDWSGKFDLVMVFDVIHDLAYPTKGLAEIMRVLKPNGNFFMRDIYMHSDPSENLDIPSAPFVNLMSLFHCMPQSLVQPEGEGLGSAWGIERAQEMLTSAGFKNVQQLGREGAFVDFLAAKT